MADVKLSVAGREYLVTCRDGEEAQLLKLGQMVDESAREAGAIAAGMSENRQLLFAALLMADKMGEMGTSSPVSAPPAPSANLEEIAVSLEKIAERLETLANGA